MRAMGLLLAGATLACSQATPQAPPKPAGVPAEAIWAGGLDGGDWILCIPAPAAERTSFECRTFSDQTGLLVTQGVYFLAKCGDDGACQPADRVPAHLQYIFFDGVLFRLSEGLSLVPDGDVDHPFGDGHGKRVTYKHGEEIREAQY
jgi:hypothetical protein